MRILTVRQPWASAIIAGDKTIENRTWAPTHPGSRIGIHAGAKIDRDAVPHVVNANVTDLSCVLGSVMISSVHAEHSAACRAHECFANRWAMWSEFPTRPMYHWILTNPRQLTTPIRAKGRLHFWESPSITHLLSMEENYR